jgi:lipopolysaccharide/colanic/teichoic acid biosynthesis glycosyltransferase
MSRGSQQLTDTFGAPGSEERLPHRVLAAIARPQAAAPGYGPDQEVAEAHRPRALESAAKRAVDIVAATLLLLIFSPAWLLCSVLIKATSAGPVLFRQQRLGVGGSTFTMLKFRTMANGSSDSVHRDFVTRYILGDARLAPDAGRTSYKLNGDHRVTKVGRFLRKLSLDEVPQLINVLRGDMSLVGPRPPLPYEVDHYQPWQRERMSVRPGITGLWQVSGRNRLTHAEMCQLDIRYIRHWSLGQDLAIMVRTPWVMLVNGGGAE